MMENASSKILILVAEKVKLKTILVMTYDQAIEGWKKFRKGLTKHSPSRTILAKNHHDSNRAKPKFKSFPNNMHD